MLTSRASSHNHGCLHYLEANQGAFFCTTKRSGHWDCSVVQGGAEAEADRHVHGAALDAVHAIARTLPRLNCVALL